MTQCFGKPVKLDKDGLREMISESTVYISSDKPLVCGATRGERNVRLMGTTIIALSCSTALTTKAGTIYRVYFYANDSTNVKSRVIAEMRHLATVIGAPADALVQLHYTKTIKSAEFKGALRQVFSNREFIEREAIMGLQPLFPSNI